LPEKEAAPTLVNIRVELFGLARIACGRSQVEVAVPEYARPGDVAAALAGACPQLVGKAIREDLSGLQQSYTFNLNGTAFMSDAPLRLKHGDAILLFSSQAGG
jgi:molybdopterin converting factor small subunit